MSEFEHTEPPVPTPDTHETAKVVRETVLNMLYFGVRGSREAVCSERVATCSAVPAVLKYDEKIRRHFGVLVGVLAAPRKFQIASQPEKDWEGSSSDGDVLYTKERLTGEGVSLETYTFPNQITSPYLNSYMAANDRLNKGDPLLKVEIQKVTGRRGELEFWKVGYGYRPPSFGHNINHPDWVELEYRDDRESVGLRATLSVFPRESIGKESDRYG